MFTGEYIYRKLRWEWREEEEQEEEEGVMADAVACQ